MVYEIVIIWWMISQKGIDILSQYCSTLWCDSKTLTDLIVFYTMKTFQTFHKNFMQRKICKHVVPNCTIEGSFVGNEEVLS